MLYTIEFMLSIAQVHETGFWAGACAAAGVGGYFFKHLLTVKKNGGNIKYVSKELYEQHLNHCNERWEFVKDSLNNITDMIKDLDGWNKSK